MRRGEKGHFHHIAGPYLANYAREASWREDNRRVSNGDQTQHAVRLAMTSGPSVDDLSVNQFHAVVLAKDARPVSCPYPEPALAGHAVGCPTPPSIAPSRPG